MSMSATANRKAVVELLEGTIGSVRTVAANKFKGDVFVGLSDQAKKAKAIQTSSGRHRFDIEIGGFRDHESTSMSAKGNRRLVRADVVVHVFTKLSTTAQASQRATDLEAILDDCETAIQALAYPGNLDQTSAAVATTFVGGMLFGPATTGVPVWRMVEEDWDEQLAYSRIEGEGVLNITQAVS